MQDHRRAARLAAAHPRSAVDDDGGMHGRGQRGAMRPGELARSTRLVFVGWLWLSVTSVLFGCSNGPKPQASEPVASAGSASGSGGQATAGQATGGASGGDAGTGGVASPVKAQSRRSGRGAG